MNYYRLQVVIRGTPGNPSELFATDNENAGETFRVRIRKSNASGVNLSAVGDMTEIGTAIGVWYYDFTMGADLSRYYLIQTSYPDAASYTDKKLIKLRLDGSLLYDDADPTKQLEFNLVGATTGKKLSIVVSPTANRTLTIPDATDTMVLLGETQTLTNKRLTSPKINEDVELAATASELNKCDGIPTTAYQIVMELVTFEETTGAGTYTGVVTVPANSLVLDVVWINTELWTVATSATLNVGDADDSDGYFVALDLKIEPAKATPTNPVSYSSFKSDAGGKGGSYKGLQKQSTSAQVITATIVTVGATGDAGRSKMFVRYATPTAVAATKA